MPVGFKTGRKPAVKDARIPRLSLHATGLPMPPQNVNKYAAVASWGMLLNDQYSCCVEAAILHLAYQSACYLTPGLAAPPTDAECAAFYSAATGWNPAFPASDQGTYVLGAGGAAVYWATKGVVCGGRLDRPAGILQITKPAPQEWRQGLAAFGNLLIGIRLPNAIADADAVPFVWDNPAPPYAGLHEILCVGYETVANEVLYDCITWGMRVRITETCLLGLIDEVVTIVDDPSPALLIDMAALASEG
jgi:hypothetical protein